MFKCVFDTILYFCISFKYCAMEEARSLWLVVDFEKNHIHLLLPEAPLDP